MIPKSMPSGSDPMGGIRFSDKIMPKENETDEANSAKLDEPPEEATP